MTVTPLPYETRPVLARRTPADVLALADDYWTLAQRIAATEFVPKSLRNRPEAVLAAFLSGAERGLPAMESLRSVHIIEGVPSLSAEAMRALVFAAGHDIQILETTAQRATVIGRRAGAETTSPQFTWTLDRARRARLANKANWQAYPEAMLLARASADLCRAWFPDVVGGLAIAEVVADDQEAPPATSTRRTRHAPARSSGAGTDPAPEPALTPAPVEAVRRDNTGNDGDDFVHVPARDRPEAVPAEEVDVIDPPAWDTPEEDAPPEEPVDPEEAPTWTEPQLPMETDAEVHDPTLAKRIHAQMREAFPDADGPTIDRYRHALTIVATRTRDTGPIGSTAALTGTEQLRLSDMIAKVRGGGATVTDGPDGTIELRAGAGWWYRITLEPVTVTVGRGPEDG